MYQGFQILAFLHEGALSLLQFRCCQSCGSLLLLLALLLGFQFIFYIVDQLGQILLFFLRFLLQVVDLGQ